MWRLAPLHPEVVDVHDPQERRRHWRHSHHLGNCHLSDVLRFRRRSPRGDLASSIASHVGERPHRHHEPVLVLSPSNTVGLKWLLMGGNNNVAPASAINYSNPFGAVSWTTTSGGQDLPVPAACTLTKLGVFGSAAPGRQVLRVFDAHQRVDRRVDDDDQRQRDGGDDVGSSRRRRRQHRTQVEPVGDAYHGRLRLVFHRCAGDEGRVVLRIRCGDRGVDDSNELRGAVGCRRGRLVVG